MASFWDGLTAGDILPSLLTTGVSLAGGLLQNKAQDKQYEEQKELQQQGFADQLRLAAIKAQFDQGGGGGPTLADLLAASAKSQMAARQNQGESFTKMAGLLMRGYGR